MIDAREVLDMAAMCYQQGNPVQGDTLLHEAMRPFRPVDIDVARSFMAVAGVEVDIDRLVPAQGSYHRLGPPLQ